MFLSDPGSFVSGKTENESLEIQNYYVGMWLEYAGVIDHVCLANVVIWVLTSVVSWVRNDSLAPITTALTASNGVKCDLF